jgi:hypothetical protein
MGSVQDQGRPTPKHRGWLLGLIVGAIGIALMLAEQAQASEGGASIYLLGSGGPGAAILPPIQGVFFENTLYDYSGSAEAGRNFQVGGNVVAGLQASIPADFLEAEWVPTTHFLEGTLAVGGALPIGGPSVDVDAILSGPLGRPITVARHDSAVVVGDPLLTGALGWQASNLHLEFGALVNVPVGNYRDGALANLAFHRWAGDTSFAATWRDAKSGWDATAKAGFTFNGTNNSTQYTTGTEFHLEGSVEKILSKHWEIGLQAYLFQQVSGDSGSGDRVGSFEGHVIGVGGQAAYSFMFGKAPITLRLHGMSEFDATNRLQGRSIWLDFVMPLWVKLPKAAPN